jgi:hypothetical protein
MTALTENPQYIRRFDEEAEIFRLAGPHQPLRDSQDTSSSVRAHPPFCLLQWCRGETESIFRHAEFFLRHLIYNYRETSYSQRNIVRR